MRLIDESLIGFGLKKARNHYAWSQLHAAELKDSKFAVVASSQRVVKRALLGNHKVEQLLLTQEVFDSLQEKWSTHLEEVDEILVTTATVIKDVVGFEYPPSQAIVGRIILRVSIPLFPETIDIPIFKDCKCLPRKPIDEIPLPLIIFDNVQSAANIGAALRTAFSLNVKSISLSEVSFAALNTRVARTSMGALFHFEIVRCLDVLSFIKCLIDEGVSVLGATPTGSEVVKDLKHEKWALVLGNEDKGSSKEVLDECSNLVRIPQIEGDSLCVTHACAIMIYELTKTAREKSCLEDFTPDVE
eukprot:GHVP01068468.1.p1 GENE.GHVP01068468.1~~GHVP01068468.1.p1  ORF type:complete len:302 (+),score=50.82 GHVP01068468.1:84-989(+)